MAWSVGSDGFGFAAPVRTARILKIPQHAGVVIEDDVEIGANSTIDRPAVGETRHQPGTKIDNLVHIAHGVTIAAARFAAQVGNRRQHGGRRPTSWWPAKRVNGHVRVGKGAISARRAPSCSRSTRGRSSRVIRRSNHAEWRKHRSCSAAALAQEAHRGYLQQRIAELEEKLAACQTPPDR